MGHPIFGVGIVFSLMSLSLGLLSSTVASDPNPNMEKASELVSQALQAEMDGDLLRREQLLLEAQRIEPNYAPARWHHGELPDGKGKWVLIDEAIEKAKSNNQLAAYVNFRAKLPPTIEGNWQAAQWCAKKKMHDQCRAHLMNIVMVDPDNRAARMALGHQQVGHDWLTTEDQMRLQERAEFAQQGFAKHESEVEVLFRRANSSDSKTSEDAKEKLREIQDPLAIPVMERAAEVFGKEVALFVATWLGTVEHPEAAQSLLRIALLSPESDVRGLAIEKLRSKPLFDFVPDLLAAMSSPIQFTSVPKFEHGVLVGYQQMFSKSSMNETKLYAIDKSFRADSQTQLSTIRNDHDATRPFGSRFRTVQIVPSDWLNSRVMEDMAIADAAINAIDAQIENKVTEARNRKLLQTLNLVLGEESRITTAESAWRWWDAYNETDYQNSKYIRQRRYSDTHYFVPLYQEIKISEGSCFVAGTQINTLRGFQPIETILPGEMVLSKNIETGELCYKPVVAATTRAPAKTVLLKIDNEVIHATSSHLLWVCGKGWTKAGDIKTGALLHSVSDPAVVMSTTVGDVLPTHNLVVADTHTYFVGTSRVLSHDVLPRGSVHERIPGQFALQLK